MVENVRQKPSPELPEVVVAVGAEVLENSMTQLMYLYLSLVQSARRVLKQGALFTQLDKTSAFFPSIPSEIFQAVRISRKETRQMLPAKTKELKH